MDFETFSERAQAIADAIPREFMGGIQSVDVHRDVQKHPFLDDIVTLGECATSPLSDPTGTEPFRSIVHLYYGSFADLASKDPSFDVEEELKETIEHEVQHHLEDRAGIKDLVDEDDLFEAHAQFRAGMEVPPGWYRRGEPLAPGLWAVDLDLFLELSLRRKEWEALRGTRVALQVMGETLEGDGLFEEDAEGEEAPADDGPTGWAGDLHVVPLVR
jgi:hypothetical protein